VNVVIEHSKWKAGEGHLACVSDAILHQYLALEAIPHPILAIMGIHSPWTFPIPRGE
jgi:hypothetical protein